MKRTQKTWTGAGAHGGEMHPVVWKYLAGRDAELDNVFLPYDIAGTGAHAKVLVAAGVMSKTEGERTRRALDALLKRARAGKVRVTADDEDSHTFIESYLTKSLGKTGRKIQTGRSRNDQALTMVRLYMLGKAGEIAEEVGLMRKAVRGVCRRAGKLVMPGYTHSQKAMPVRVSVFFESYDEALADDLRLLKHICEILNQCPLGSASGFGLPMKWPRDVARKELGFAKIQNNPVYCHATRGKFDRMFIFGLQNLAATLCRFACDMVMFTQQEFGFFSLPASFTTGSSFMPNKKNYDLFELARASRAAIDGAGTEAGLYGFNMISGYHRDLQRTKETLTKAVEETFGLVGVLTIAMENLQINREQIRRAVTPEMHSTAKAMALAMKGVPFRDAYLCVKAGGGS